MPKLHRANAGAGPRQRQLRVGELLRHALAEVLQHGEIMDRVLESHVVTVPEVRMSPDLKLATCFVMPLGGKDGAEVVAALEHHRRAVRSAVASKVDLKFAPDLRFRLDTSFDEGARVDELLRRPEVARDLERHDDEDDQ
jgi:ribosome-binding factor A